MTAPTHHLLGTRCHEGHPMQATAIAWVELDTEGELAELEDSGPFFDASDARLRVYCSEDCPDIPEHILAAARHLFAEACPL